VANRPDLGLNVKPGVAPSLATPFTGEGDLAQSLHDYIGGRTADGDTPAAIMADIQSQSFFDKVGGRADEYRAALDKLAPLRGEDGSMQRAEALDAPFNTMADAYVKGKYGATRSTMNRQQVKVDDVTTEALHRALAAHPDGVAAYKQIGELSNQDQRALRETFYRDIARESPEAAGLRKDAEEHAKNEPEAEEEDMFGEKVPNPEHAAWVGKRDDLARRAGEASLDWNKYVQTMGGIEKAYESVQDTIKSRVGEAFAQAHNTLRPDAPIKVGRAVIRNNLNHLDATDPVARDARLAKERELTDSLRERNAGRYAQGSVSGKIDAARDQREAFEQSQRGMFSSEDTDAPKPADMAGDERHTLGHEAERQIAAMMGQVGQNFKPGKPTKLFNPEMSTGKNAARQRLVKLVDANKRVTAAFGTGSGKTLLQMASFTHLHEQGKAKRGIFLVPSIVQGQFGGEALRFIDPNGNGGKGYNWHCQPGANRAERIAAYKNKDHHFVVMTHQSFRDDMLHLGAQHAGIGEQEMASRLNAMTRPERKTWMHELMTREGIDADYATVDESQNISNRAGKDNSSQANVLDALGDNTPYLLHATADPVKNDASEAFDMMAKMDPARYSDRGAFMRRYGADTLASKDALKREMARHVYPSKIDPDVKADRKTSTVPLSNGQKAALSALDKNLSKARLARMGGAADVEAMKAISPSSFENVPAAEHEKLAHDLMQNIGILKLAAQKRIINEHPDNAKMDDLVAKAAERKGKPGVVFAHSLKSVQMIKDRLEAAGHRVVMLTGADSGADKEKKRLAFNPESGEASADIMVASDAGATGMNIQRGQWLYQLDTPDTAMTHGQRQGRIFRTGQKNDVELLDSMADHPSERAARTRLERKQGLREMMQSPMEGLDDTGVAHYINQKRVALQAGAQTQK
jgi:superfamily II DNA or RNA helicase